MSQGAATHCATDRRHLPLNFQAGMMLARCYWCGVPIHRRASNLSWWYTTDEAWQDASEGPSGLIPEAKP